MSAQDQDLLDTLTDEERAAMGDDDIPAGDREALAAIAGDSPPADTATDEEDDGQDDEDDEGDDDGSDGGDAGAAEAGAADAGAAEAAQAGAADAADTGAADTVAQADEADDDGPTLYNAQLPADYKEKWDGLAARVSDVQAKFNEGEIDLAERDAQLAQLQDERDSLLMVRARIESLQEADQRAVEAHWNNQIKALFKQAKAEPGAIDYAKDQAKAADLDLFIKQLANRPENESKSGAWFLAEAHKRVKALHGIASAADPAAAARTKQETLAKAKASRKPPIDAVPENLAGVPGGDGPGDVASEFADIEALEGQAYEDAIARMTPAQREKFLSS